MKKIVFKIIIFISIKKQQQKMSNTSEIVNFVFDWRSVGGIIMSYIETPKEEYKQRFDLVVKEMDEKVERSGIFGCKYECPRDCECVKARDKPFRYTKIRERLNWVYKMKDLIYTPEENEQLIVILYTIMVNEGYYEKFGEYYSKNSMMFPRELVEGLLKRFVKTQEYHPLVVKCFSTSKNYYSPQCFDEDFMIYSRRNNPSLFGEIIRNFGFLEGSQKNTQ